ncbi:MAG: AAA family ATPase [Planctomycetes bacterium]|nr:AAA family ATPase [Planctomycetota bacterium]
MLHATIDRVNENFSHIFRKLFGGGKAELVIVEPRTVVDKQTQIPFPADKTAEPPVEAPQAPEPVAPDQKPARNDILESGIDIIAKPPGKEPSSISLLSGGEKSLTAIALVMAIFKLKASPFCILDEADSALDEHNLDRFAALIKEFSSNSQFIVITHNKKTMMHANILYGLTMQTPGVSKKVSVKMDDKGVAQPVQPAANN